MANAFRDVTKPRANRVKDVTTYSDSKLENMMAKIPEAKRTHAPPKERLE